MKNNEFEGVVYETFSVSGHRNASGGIDVELIPGGFDMALPGVGQPGGGADSAGEPECIGGP